MADNKSLFSKDELQRVKLTAELNQIISQLFDAEAKMKAAEKKAEHAYFPERNPNRKESPLGKEKGGAKGGANSAAYKKANAEYLALKQKYDGLKSQKSTLETKVSEIEKKIKSTAAEGKATEQAATDKAAREKKVKELQDKIDYKKSMGFDYSAEQNELNTLEPKANVPNIPTSSTAGPAVPGVKATTPAGPTIVNPSVTGKAPWQMSVNGPQFSYPTGYNAGDAVFMGKEYTKSTGPGSGGGNPYDVYATKSDALNTFYTMDDASRKQLVSLANTMGISAQSAWNTAIDAAAAQLNNGSKLSPLAALQQFVNQGLRSGAIVPPQAPITSMTTTRRDYTSKMNAQALVDSALSNYLGRAATASERNAFYAELHAAEKANPTVTKQTGLNTATPTVISEGGVNSEQMAKSFAQKQQGAGEYAASTKYLNTFLQSLANPINIAGV